MSRQPKINKVALAHRLDKILSVGNGALVGVPTLSSVALGTIAGIPLAITNSAFYLFLYSPALLGLSIILTHYRSTVEMKGSSNQWREVITKILPKLGMEKEMAQPLVEKIYQHTLDGHPGGGVTYNYSNCKVCAKRVALLRELVPNKPTDESDMDLVRFYIEERNKLRA